jgi:hypothetical protein
MGEDEKTPRLSTRQLLGHVPKFPGLFRHSINGTYYGIKKIAGKRKEYSLDAMDRKVAEKRLACVAKLSGSRRDEAASSIRKRLAQELDQAPFK